MPIAMSSTTVPNQAAANVVEQRIGPAKTRKLPQSIQSPEGVDLILSRDGRIELRAPSAPSARLAETARVYRRRPDARLEPTVLSCVSGARRVAASGDPLNPIIHR